VKIRPYGREDDIEAGSRGLGVMVERAREPGCRHHLCPCSPMFRSGSLEALPGGARKLLWCAIMHVKRSESVSFDCCEGRPGSVRHVCMRGGPCQAEEKGDKGGGA